MGILVHFCKKTKHLHADCVCNALLCEQRINPKNYTCYFDLFSDASNSRSLQATHFAEYVDILEYIVNAIFTNDREKDKRTIGIPGE